MLKSIYETVDRAPFSGKYAIRSSIADYIAVDESKEKSQLTKTASLLGVMVVAHAYQAYMGYNATRLHVEHFQNTENPIDLMLTTVDSTYAFVNSAVTIRQANLMKRVAQIRAKKIEEFDIKTSDEVIDKNEKTKRKLTQKGVLAATALTLVGQAVFLGSYVDAQHKDITNKCYETATEYYDTYSGAHPDLELESKEEYLEMAC